MTSPVAADLDLPAQVGQLICVAWGRHGTAGVNSGLQHDQLDDTLDLVSRLGVSGVCYFPSAPDGDDPSDVAAGLARLRAVAAIPLMTSIDQEGGRVRRLKHGVTEVPAARDLGADPDRVRTLAATLGAELVEIGFTQVLAPVADVDSNPDNPVIANRSYAADPHQVARCVTAAIDGFHSVGIACAVKHFPGHGDTSTDSHRAIPRIDRSRANWWALEAVPFQAAISAGVDAVMLGHLIFPALDDRLATVSAPVVQLLRDDLGFTGLIMTDALGMAGATDGRRGEDLWVDAVAAGVDLLLMPTDARAAHAALMSAVQSGRLSAERVAQACARVLAFKGQTGTPAAVSR